jgi:diaminohydroxyphosphoribosylaminopyrimidine deaminase/5-amino-6-(5-phosphoribosylamino)uracil reductase
MRWALQIGGTRAPTPVGDLGFVEMTQALQLAEVKWQQTGPDLMLTGYLPQSGGLRALAAAAAVADASSGSSSQAGGAVSAAGLPSSSSCGSSAAGMAGDGGGAKRHPGARLAAPGVAEFYKAWDRYGCLSNFSPHAISMPEGAMTCARLPEHQQHLLQQEQEQRAGTSSTSSSSSADQQQQEQRQQWSSTEHYYQAQKFTGSAHPEAAALVAAIAAAASPEEAAALGRRAQRQRPELLRSDWDAAKVSVMLGALRAKFAAHAGPRRLLLATARDGVPQAAGTHSRPSSSASGLQLVESSPHDFFWGRGYDGSGANMLGKLLMQVRGELLLQQQLQQPQAGQQPPAQQQQQPAGV